MQRVSINSHSASMVFVVISSLTICCTGPVILVILDQISWDLGWDTLTWIFCYICTLSMVRKICPDSVEFLFYFILINDVAKYGNIMKPMFFFSTMSKTFLFLYGRVIPKLYQDLTTKKYKCGGHSRTIDS